MRNTLVSALAVATAVLGLTTFAGTPAGAAPPVVEITSSNAQLDIFQFVNDQTQATPEVDDSDFFQFARHRAPARLTGPQGSASAFVSQATGLETPGQPPFPTGPLNDISVSGTATSAATGRNPAGGQTAVPVSDSEGSAGIEFQTSQPVPIFFDATMHTDNSDVDSCSSVDVELTGPGTFDHHFSAFAGGDCPAPGPHNKSVVESLTIPAGEYQFAVHYESEVSDARPDEPASMSASAVVSTNISFFPPAARFSTTLSGSTAHFDGSRSAAGRSGGTITTWEWDFGDGTHAATNRPTVTHTYPAGPAAPPTYTVSLQVVDNRGAISEHESHDILGTSASVHVTKANGQVHAAGAVRPGRPGKKVTVTLQRRRNGAFRAVATHHPALSPGSHFSTSFARTGAGSCRVVATYPGDATHLAGTGSERFAC